MNIFISYLHLLIIPTLSFLTNRLLSIQIKKILFRLEELLLNHLEQSQMHPLRILQPIIPTSTRRLQRIQRAHRILNQSPFLHISRHQIQQALQAPRQLGPVRLPDFIRR